jgi:hypothetical protein
MRRVVVVLALLCGCAKAEPKEQAPAEPTEGERVAKAAGLERDGKLAEARAALPDDCDEAACFEARVRIGKALAAALEQSGLDAPEQVRLYLAASIEASDRDWPVCAYMDIIARHVSATPAHPVLVEVLTTSIEALKVEIPEPGDTTGVRLAHVSGADAAVDARTCDAVGSAIMNLEGTMRGMVGSNDGNGDRRADAFAYAFLRAQLDEALRPPPPPPPDPPAKKPKRKRGG